MLACLKAQNMRFCTKLLLLSYILTCSFWGRGQHMPPEHIGIEQGLPQGFVTAILQDREGFMWFGSPNCLSRYDGYRFRQFKYDPFDPFSLGDNHVTSLCDWGAFLLVGTANGGLFFFHKKTERFFKLPYAHLEPGNALRGPQRIGHVPGNLVMDIKSDAWGQIWLVTSNNLQGPRFLVRVKVPKDLEQHLPSKPDLADRAQVLFWINDAYTEAMHRGFFHSRMLRVVGKTIIWLTSRQCLKFDSTAQDMRPFAGVSSAFAPADNYVPVGQEAGYFWQTQLGQTWYVSKTGQERPLADKLPMLLHSDGQFIWAQAAKELLVFKQGSDPGLTDFSKPLWRYPVDDIRNLYCLDRSGNFWWAERVTGVLKFSPHQLAFQHFFKGESPMLSPFPCPTGGYVIPFITRLPLFSSPQSERYWSFFSEQLVRNHWEPFYFATETTNTYWVLVYTPGGQNTVLLNVNPVSRHLRHWVLPVGRCQRTVCRPGPDGTVWIPSCGKLLRFDPQKGTWATFDFSQLDSDAHVYTGLEKTADGSWWIASEFGIIQAKPIGTDKTTPRFGFFWHQTNPNDRNTLNYNNVSCLLTDTHDPFVLWIGTRGGGCNRLDVRTMQWQHLSTRNGLPDDVIYGILPDNRGRLWISSNKGLTCYDPSNRQIRNYRQSDGLQSDEFNTNAYAKGFNGELMFGGVNGINVFHPNQVPKNTLPPNTFIAQVKVNNQTLEMGDLEGRVSVAPPFCRELQLHAHENNLTFEFAALDFSASGSNRYRYYLEGAEEAWVHEGNEPTASYLNLAPGTYTFKVLGSNNDLVWSESPAELRVIIHPPWYRSIWAYGAYILLLGTIVYVFFKNREAQMRLQITLEKQRIAAREAALALEQEKLEAAQLSARLEAERQETVLALAKKALEAAQQEAQWEAERRKAAQNLEAQQQLLATFTQELLEKSKRIADLEALLGNTPTTPPEHLRSALCEAQLLHQEEWQKFRRLFEQTYPGFFNKLAARFPNLTNAEKRLFMVTKLGLRGSEAASMLGITADGVRKTSLRLRRKLGAPDKELGDFLEGL